MTQLTKKEIVDDITTLNADLVLAFLSVKFPILQIGIVKFIAKHYLMKWLEPMANEGTVFVAFKVIDVEQAVKAGNSIEARDRLRIAVESGVPDEQSEIAFDNTFRDAIRVKP